MNKKILNQHFNAFKSANLLLLQLVLKDIGIHPNLHTHKLLSHVEPVITALQSAAMLHLSYSFPECEKNNWT